MTRKTRKSHEIEQAKGVAAATTAEAQTPVAAKKMRGPTSHVDPSIWPSDPGTMVDRKPVAMRGRFSQSKVMDMERQGLWPRPIRMPASNASRWFVAEIDRMLDLWARGADEQQVRSLVADIEDTRKLGLAAIIASSPRQAARMSGEVVARSSRARPGSAYLGART